MAKKTKSMDFWGGKVVPVRKNTKWVPKQSKNKKLDWNWEQTKRHYPHIKKWGDIDMDGSPNWLDCKPLDASRDGIFSALASAFSKIKGGFKRADSDDEEYLPEEKKYRPKWHKKKGKAVSSIIEAQREKAQLESGKVSRAKLLLGMTGDLKKTEMRGEKELESKLQQHPIERLKLAGKQEKQDLKRLKIKKQVQAEQAISKKIKSPKGFMSALDEKGRRLGSIISRNPAGLRTHLGQLTTTLTGIETGTKKEFHHKYHKQTGLKGRPVGTWKYSIPGKGKVPVQVYKAWLAREKAKYRIKGSAGQETQPIRYRTYGQPTEHQPAVRTAVVSEEGVVEVERPVMEKPIVQQPGQEEYRQHVPEEYYEEQRRQQIQQMDNPLHAPNINKGEMVGSAQGTFAGGPTGSTILQAPNVNKGEMRNEYYQPRQRGETTQHFDTVQRPVINEYGDEYIDIDPASGRPLLRRRIRERWIQPDAP